MSSTAEGDVPVLDILKREKRQDSLGRETLCDGRRGALLRAFESSGLSQAAFARREGLVYSTFAGWVQARRRESDAYTSYTHRIAEASDGNAAKAKATTPRSARTEFRELTVSSPSSPAPAAATPILVVFGAIEARCADIAGAAALMKALAGTC